MKAKRAKKEKKERRKINLTVKQKRLAVIVAVVLVIGMIAYGGQIIKLRAENRELKAQQEELEKEKAALTKELKNIHSKDYIQDQARKQLRLLNKDEILFIFEGDEDENKDK